jgi:ABC-2 type transport system permease protein
VIARVARTAEQASVAQSILAITLGMAGGAFFPVAAAGILGTILDLNPIAAFTRGLGVTAGGGGLADIAVPVASMLGFAVVAVLVSRLVPDRGRL